MFGIRMHRKEQWDLQCWPWLCVHRDKTDDDGTWSNTRLFCVWKGGLQVGRKVWTW